MQRNKHRSRTSSASSRGRSHQQDQSYGRFPSPEQSRSHSYQDEESFGGRYGSQESPREYSRDYRRNSTYGGDYENENYEGSRSQGPQNYESNRFNSDRESMNRRYSGSGISAEESYYEDQPRRSYERRSSYEANQYPPQSQRYSPRPYDEVYGPRRGQDRHDSYSSEEDQSWGRNEDINEDDWRRPRSRGSRGSHSRNY